VATLVGRAAAPEEVFAAVTEEAGRLLGADYTTMIRYDADGAGTVVAPWSGTGGLSFSVGARARLGGRNVQTLVFQTHRPARIDDYADASGPIAEVVRELGFRAAVGVPVCVEREMWGVIVVGSRVELRGFADEQAALRRVATLVAHVAPPEEVLAAVTEEAGRLLHTDYATMNRYGTGDTTVIATWSGIGAGFPVGTKQKLSGRNLHTMIFQTHRPARIDDYREATGPIA
jgi:transcriptional regulator with GAF, ATPase, and Fis domain